MGARHARILEKELSEATSPTPGRSLKEYLSLTFQGTYHFFLMHHRTTTANTLRVALKTDTNSKTADLNTYLNYAGAAYSAAMAASDFRALPTWRKNRFRRWEAKRKSVMRFSRRIREIYGDDVVLFLGSSYTKTQSKFMPPTKGIGLYRELRSLGHLIYLVDEYMTSQVSFRTGSGEKSSFFA